MCSVHSTCKMTSVKDHFMSVNSTLKGVLYCWKTSKLTLLGITKILSGRNKEFVTLHKSTIRFNDKQLESSVSHELQMEKWSSVLHNIIF
jgi:hypothetical protein